MSGAVPNVELRVNGTPLGPATMERLTSIELVQTCDGADVLTINADAWDAIAQQFRLLDERVLFPGNEVEVWAGYPGDDRFPGMACKGLYKFDVSEPEYTKDGVTLAVTAYDGLQRLMKHTQARVYKGETRCSDIVRRLAVYHGFAPDWSDDQGWMTVADAYTQSNARADLAQHMQLPGTAPVASPRNPVRRAIEDTPEIRGDRTKPRGETDLAWLKRMAIGYGFMLPKVRYEPAGQGKRGREVLTFRRPVGGPDEFSQTFWWRKPGTDQCDLLRFKPSFSLQDAPAGIEILGWDAKTSRPIRIVAKMTATGEPEILWDTDVRADEKIDDSIKNGGSLRLSIVGTGTQVVKLKRANVDGQTWIPEKDVAEVLTTESIHGMKDATREDLEMLARLWLRQRQASWWTFEFDMENQPGLHLLDSDQVHEFRGVASMHECHGIILKVTHNWNPQTGTHRVTGTGQRLNEDPGETVTQQRAYA